MGCGGIRTKHPLLSKESQINLIIWSGNEELSREMMSKLLPNKEASRDIWSYRSGSIVLTGYIRWAKGQAKEGPKGMTDILVIFPDEEYSEIEDSESFKECKNYALSRQDIPFFYMVYGNSLTDQEQIDKTLNAKHLTKEQFQQPTFLSEIVENSSKLDNSLKTAFCEYDLNQNMFITSDELEKVSKNLSTPITLEEAKKIAYSIDPKKGNIEYEKFKYYWMLRGSGLNFTKIRTSVNKMISMEKLAKGSEALKDYMEKMKSDQGTEEGTEIKINFIATEKFTPGSSLKSHLLIGEQAKEEISLMNEKLKASPISWSLKIPFNDQSNNHKIVQETLEKLMKQLFSTIENLNNYTEMGLCIDIEEDGANAILNFSFSHGAADEISSVIHSILKLRELSVQADAKVNLTTESAVIHDILDDKCESKNFVKKLMNLNFLVDFTFSNFSKILNAMRLFYENNYGYMNYQIKQFFKSLQLLQILTSVNNEIKYSPNLLLKFLFGEMNQQETTEQDLDSNTKVLSIAGGVKEFFKNVLLPMLGNQVIKEMLRPLLVLNFDQISGFILIAAENVLLKIELNIGGVSELVQKIVK